MTINHPGGFSGTAGKKWPSTVRAEGDATRFEKAEQAFRSAQQATESRLYLETIEAVLPGKKKLIIDKSQGGRHLLLLQDGIRPLPQ